MSAIGRCCLFRLGEAHFALPATTVRQVVSTEFLSLVPLSPHELKGLFVLRGQAVALIDLAALMGLPITQANMSHNTRLGLIFEQDHLALSADEVLGFATPERLTLDTARPFELGSFSIDSQRFVLLDDQLLMRGLDAAFGA